MCFPFSAEDKLKAVAHASSNPLWKLIPSLRPTLLVEAVLLCCFSEKQEDLDYITATHILAVIGDVLGTLDD
jgi:hypothetical protein